ncbi:MAG: hypothetical protein JWM34_4431 [Ilumatobacteraceae bacterium]|nr:hypothetical protein [Ilumatobacteraceae bacterium]
MKGDASAWIRRAFSDLAARDSRWCVARSKRSTSRWLGSGTKRMVPALRSSRKRTVGSGIVDTWAIAGRRGRQAVAVDRPPRRSPNGRYVASCRGGLPGDAWNLEPSADVPRACGSSDLSSSFSLSDSAPDAPLTARRRHSATRRPERPPTTPRKPRRQSRRMQAPIRPSRSADRHVPGRLQLRSPTHSSRPSSPEIAPPTGSALSITTNSTRPPSDSSSLTDIIGR